jgi:CopG family nickel-responsive transcriptional regulator
MAIISVSLSDSLLEEIDLIRDEMGFSGRSEVLRTSARLLISENKEKSRLEGNVNSVLIVIHDRKLEDRVTDIKHDFEDIINTQIHSHLQDDKCLELFILDGDAQRMTLLTKKFQSNRMDYVKLIVVQ